MIEHLFILGLLLIALVLFASEKIRADFVAMIIMLILILTGTVTIDEGFSGFSNPAVITVIAMFILSAGLERTGVADYLGNIMLKASGTHPVFLTATVMMTVGLMSAFMNNIGATVILITPVFAISRKINYPVSKLLIPVSFGSLLGGLTTMIGTPPNLLVSMALEDAGFVSFKMFDFLPTGLAVMGAGMLYMSLIGRHLIPVRNSASNFTTTYHLENYITEVSIPEGSSLDGSKIKYARLIREIGLTVLRVRRNQNGTLTEMEPSPDTVLQKGDRLLIEGNLEKLFKVIETRHLVIHIKSKINDEALTGKSIKLAEVVLSHKARVIGQSIRQSNIKRRYGILALALRKRERTIDLNYVDQPLDIGDVILVQGTPENINELAGNDEFLVINNLEPKLRDRKRAKWALLSMAVAIATAATGLLHISVAGLIGVLLMVFTGSVKVDQIYRDIEWRVIFLIACMMPLSIAMDENHTGTAAWIGNFVIELTGGYGPYIVLGCLLIAVTMVTEVMSNAAAAVLMAPIGISIATGMNLEPYPFLMAVAIGASSTFLTPIGHQANVLVYGMGGYKFTDFTRVGVLLNLIILTITMTLVPVVWPFTALK